MHSTTTQNGTYMTTPNVHEIKPAAFYRDSSTDSLRRWRDSGTPTYAEQMKIDQELGNRAHANRRAALDSLTRPGYVKHAIAARTPSAPLRHSYDALTPADMDAYRSRCAEIRALDARADAARSEY